MTEKEYQEKKREAYEFGVFAEEIASHEYIKRGYTVLERKWRLGHTEIDLIVQKDNVVVIAEVKARKSGEDAALLSVTVDKRKRMIKAADAYIRKLPGNCEYRFDIVTCTGSPQDYQLEIFEDAFVAADVF